MIKFNGFTHTEVTRWRTVSQGDLVRIANMCTPGIDFVSCSKDNIYNSVAKYAQIGIPCGGGRFADRDKFVLLMDQAAEITRRYKAEMAGEIAKLIRDNL